MNRPIRDYDVKKLMVKLGRIYKKESEDGQNTIKKEMGMGTPNLRAWRACIVFIHMPVCNLLPLISILENHDKKPKSPHEFLWGRLLLLVSFCLNHMHSYSGCKLSLFFVPLNLLCFCFIHTAQCQWLSAVRLSTLRDRPSYTCIFSCSFPLLNLLRPAEMEILLKLWFVFN